MSQGITSHESLQTTFRRLAISSGFSRPKLDNASDRWEFPIPIHDKVIRYLQTHPHRKAVPLEVNPLQPKLLARMEAIRLNANDNKGFPSTSSLISSGVPPQIASSMAPFQRGAVRFSVGKGGVAFIADEMGLGKTLQSIAVMSKFKGDWPLLVVCPSAARFHWQSELIRWLGKEAGEKGWEEEGEEAVEEVVFTRDNRGGSEEEEEEE